MVSNAIFPAENPTRDIYNTATIGDTIPPIILKFTSINCKLCTFNIFIFFSIIAIVITCTAQYSSTINCYFTNTVYFSPVICYVAYNSSTIYSNGTACIYYSYLVRTLFPNNTITMNMHYAITLIFYAFNLTTINDYGSTFIFNRSYNASVYIHNAAIIF